MNDGAKRMPSVKEAAQEVIDTLPEQATWDDLMYELYVTQKLEQGLADVDAGRTVTHEALNAELLGDED